MEEEAKQIDLPEDIISSVLARLPVKVLCRLRCVSRAWRALISEPAFAAAQRSHATGPLIAAMFGSSPNHELRLLDVDDGSVLRVFQTMESAMLAPTRLDIVCVDRLRVGAMIIDPAAGRVFTVGTADMGTWWKDYSFGRATPSGAYKLLRQHRAKDTSFCEVATITDGTIEPTWRQRPPPNLVTCFLPEHKVTINGVLYFMPDGTCTGTPGWNRVAAFDLESEVWMETISGPPLGFKKDTEEWDIALTELKGTLCMVQNVRHHDDVCFLDYGLYANIWRLNEGVWVKAYTIQMPANCLHIQALNVLNDGRILLLNNSCFRVVLQVFNPSTEAFVDIMDMAEGFCGRVTVYTGSLLSC